jgi:phospholipid/cholesterol/gamma-HCH transport system permease protein
VVDLKNGDVQGASILLLPSDQLKISGGWTAQSIPLISIQLQKISLPKDKTQTVLAKDVTALDTAGAWVLYDFLRVRLSQNSTLRVEGLAPQFDRLLHEIADHQGEPLAEKPKQGQEKSFVRRKLVSVGQASMELVVHTRDFLAFIGEAALTFARWVIEPSRIRWRPVLFNIRSAGLDALPIVSLLSILLGVVVGYQGADQLRRYGASIFIADIVGLSMVREFAPLMTAIIIAGRSGSAYAAQIGTMAVTEEIDAMKTIGIEPMDVLVLPKVIGLLIALPLLTVFADFLGIIGGMIMAQQKLGISFPEFLGRLAKAVSLTAFFIGIGKAPVFAGIIALVGCYQGFRTKGGADSVGRQTTRSVVQAVFLVIVADALFSIAFSALDL